MVHFGQFLLLVIILVLVPGPGPDYILITKNTVSGGTKAGFKTILGTVSALICHTSFAVLGLSAIIVKSAMLFTVLKYLGAIYLIYLGIKSFLTKTQQTTIPKSQKNVYLQGFITNILNPKVAVFFLTFLPQFVTIESTSWLPFTLLGLTYVVVTFLIYSVYILFLAKVQIYLERPLVKAFINKFSGVVLILFGAKLLATKH